MDCVPISLPQAGFAYLPAPTRVFSRGVIALDHHALRRITLETPLPMESGLILAANFIRQSNRPLESLCAIELRIPNRLPPPQFAKFNARYIAALQAAGFPTDPTNPAARTNMAPVHNPPADATLHAFTFAIPAAGKAQDFVLSGKPELDGNRIIAPGDTSPSGMHEKAAFVLHDLQATLQQLGGTWSDITAAHIYTRHPLPPIQFTRFTHIPGDPPVTPFEFEADIRSITHEETM